MFWFLVVCGLIGPFVSASDCSLGQFDHRHSRCKRRSLRCGSAQMRSGSSCSCPCCMVSAMGGSHGCAASRCAWRWRSWLVIGLSVLVRLGDSGPDLAPHAPSRAGPGGLRAGRGGRGNLSGCANVRLDCHGHERLFAHSVGDGQTSAMCCWRRKCSWRSSRRRSCRLRLLWKKSSALPTRWLRTLKETREAWGAIIGAEARYRLVVDHVSETVMRVAPGGWCSLLRLRARAFLRDRPSRVATSSI